MAEELKNLIDRIQREGIDKARAEAEEIVSAARREAAGLIEAAGQQADSLRKKAEADAKAREERSIMTIGQAGRNVLIAVGGGVETMFRGLIRESLAESLTADQMMQMIVALAGSYAKHEMKATAIEVLVSDDDREKMKQLFMEKYRQVLGDGVEIRSDDDIVKGFKISLKDGKVYHDFTLEAITDAISVFLRPEIEEAVREAAKEPEKAGRKTEDGTDKTDT